MELLSSKIFLCIHHHIRKCNFLVFRLVFQSSNLGLVHQWYICLLFHKYLHCSLLDNNKYNFLKSQSAILHSCTSLNPDPLYRSQMSHSDSRNTSLYIHKCTHRFFLLAFLRSGKAGSSVQKSIHKTPNNYHHDTQINKHISNALPAQQLFLH